MSGWSARDAGRSEADWVRALPWGEIPSVDIAAVVQRFERVLVLAAHPDDETLAVGATMAALAAAGARVDVLLVTDGEASHPRSTMLSRDVVRIVRQTEFTDALDALGAHGERRCLQVEDGRVNEAREHVAEELTNMVRQHPQTLVIAPWPRDGHADHDALGEVTQQVCVELDVPCVFYPLWLWHWADDDAVPTAGARLVVPGVPALEAKAAALAAYPSQTGTFGLPAREMPVLQPGVLAHFDRLVEVLFDPAGVLSLADGGGLTLATSFDEMFAAGDDPWGVETRWYELRRQRIVEAVLPDEWLGRLLDVGSSTGVLTRALAPRAVTVVALDQSEKALAVARARPAPDGASIEWRQAVVPQDLEHLSGPFDTIILSEVGYFLDGRHLLWLLARLDALLADGGVVLSAHWQHETKNIPLDGRFVTRTLGALWPAVARYEDADVVITVHRRD